MYSYEDRTRAVELYIKLGLRPAATICQLGYPTKNALRSLYREYRLVADLTRSYVRTKAKYSKVQMDTAIAHYLEHCRCIASPSRHSATLAGTLCGAGLAMLTPTEKHALAAVRLGRRGRRR